MSFDYLYGNEDDMKKVISINENRFNAMVSKMVKESIKRMMNEEECVDVRSMVENYLKRINMYDPPIEWINDNTFTDRHGFDGHIYRSKQEAYKDVVDINGNEHQNAIDMVDGVQTDDDWVDYLIKVGVDPKEAENIIRNHDWDDVVEIIADADGPEWFLSSYSGQVHNLDDGSLLFY